MPPTLPRFAELVRVSTGAQADRETPEDQRRALDRLRASRPGTFVERIEAAESGALAGRERATISRLLELCAARAIDEVRVRHLDRLTRHPDVRERAAIFGALADAGAVIVDAAGHVIDPASEIGEVDYALQSWMAVRERKRIAERTHAAKVRLAAEGRLVSSWPPFGRTFDRRTGKWGTDPARMEIGRRIFAEVVQGASLAALAARLNEEGVPTASGRGRWTQGSLSRFLRARTAVGEYRSHGHVSEIPALVDRATFDAAAARLAGARWVGGGPAPKHPALLRKLLVCGACGCTLYVDKGGTGRHAHLYYLCSGGDPECRTHHRVERLDELVRERVRSFLERPDVLEAGAAHRKRGERVDPEKEAKAAAKALKAIDAEEERLARLTRIGALSMATGTKMLREVTAKRKAAESRLAAARARSAADAKAGEDLAAVRDRIAALRKRLARASAEEWREVLGVLFPRSAGGIVVWPDGRVELRGALSLGTAGAQAIGRRGKDLPPSGRLQVVPALSFTLAG